MEQITRELLEAVTDGADVTCGAYSIRENASCYDMHSTENIKIVPKKEKPGIDIYISGNTKGELVFIPAVVTHSDVNDLVYNDFHIEENADVIIMAGCGVHVDDEDASSHNGIHRFFLGKNSHAVYKERHVGSGTGKGKRLIDPVTEATLLEGAVLEMETQQLAGVDRTIRKTKATLEAKAKLIIHESLLTDDDNEASTQFEVMMNGEDSSVDLISRSVAKGNSIQRYESHIIGNCRCSGHSECDAILVGNGKVDAAPALFAADIDAALIHEAAIGKIAGEQIIKLETLGLTEEEAENVIIEGFLAAD